MILTLFKHSLKEKFRSKSRGRNIILNIFIFLFFIYFLAIFTFTGYFIPRILKEDALIDVDIYELLNNYLLFYIGFDIMFRILLQSLPIISIKPYLTLPIGKGKIANFLLLKSFFSLFNLFPAMFFIAYSLNFTDFGLSKENWISWLVVALIIVQISNYLNILIKRISNAKFRIFFIILIIYSGIYLLDLYDIFFLRIYFGNFVAYSVQNPQYILVFALALIVVYYLNHIYIRSQFDLDNLDNNNDSFKERSMEWADGLGDISPYVKKDIKMILRNKRPRTVLYMSIGLLLYGLFFYPNPIYKEMSYIKVFVAMFITGIFSLNFGQFVPAWDTGHYNLLMTQKTNLVIYVKSKFAIMAFSVIIALIFSTPYVYFGADILLFHFVAALYNIGVNISILLLLSSYNNKRIDLDSSSVMNYQGVGAKQWLMVIPTLLLPGLIFWLVDKFFGGYSGFITLAAMGIFGILFHKKLILIVAEQLAERKHSIIEAFKEK
jgi:hypothetical protein